MRLTLVQKVLLSIVVLFLVTSSALSLVVASQIKEAYLSEQKRNVAEFVQKQARQHLNKTDFQTNDAATLPRFITYQDEIITPEIVRVKIYDTKGIVLYSDEKELIGQYLFAEEPDELKEILEGNIVAGIATPSKTENIYERQYGQLLEIYTPIAFDNSGVVGIVETYYQLNVLNGEILKSQLYLIGSIAVFFTILLVLLFLIVKRASRTLIEQDKQLKADILKEQEYSSLKNEFIKMSSHQLRTPASAIKWSLEILADEKNSTFSADQRELLKSIGASTESLISIIDNSLTISDIKPDYFVLEEDTYSLLDLTRDALKNREKKIGEKKLIIELTPSQSLSNINLRKDAMNLVVGKLIDNAIDYTPVGGKINVFISQKDKRQYFEIRDTGIGIPESDQAKIFDKLFRAGNSIDQKNVGSGLSLYIVKKIVDGYTGKIRFISNQSGSSFVFEIPTI